MWQDAGRGGEPMPAPVSNFIARTEPMNALSFPKFLLVSALMLSLGQAEDKAIPYDVLSVHKTEATFKGTREHKCMGRTSLCPDQCGHSGTLAVFAIEKYIEYKKPGEYGDPKQETFQFLVEDNKKNPKVPADIVAIINALKPGDKVELDWEHRYMNNDGSRYPERQITRVKKRM